MWVKALPGQPAGPRHATWAHHLLGQRVLASVAARQLRSHLGRQPRLGRTRTFSLTPSCLLHIRRVHTHLRPLQVRLRCLHLALHCVFAQLCPGRS